VEDRFIGFGRDHLRRWRPLLRGGKTHRFVGTELEPYVAVAFYGRHSAYFTSILSGVNVSCNTEGAWMQIGDERFDGDDIQRLYQSDDFPLQRRLSD
jgi:hypothetical protein